MVYFVGKKWFGKPAGLIAAALYAVSPVVITYSHSSWNPNPLPFVALLVLYLTYLSLTRPSVKKFIIIGILLGIAIQLQYLALFLFVVLFAYLFFGTIIAEKKLSIILLIKRYLMIGVGFLIGWSPFLAFEVHHGFPNLWTIFRFLTGQIPESVPTHSTPLGQVFEVFFKLFGRLVTVYPLTFLSDVHKNTTLYVWYLLTLVLAVIAVLGIIRIKDRLAQLLFILWLVIGVGLFALYKKQIYDYYLGFMFPLPFLLIGNAAQELVKAVKLRFVQIVVVILVAFLFIFNLWYMPFRFEPNRIKNQVETIAKLVILHTNNQPYNFALITTGNSDHAYRYYLEILGHKPVEIENPAIDPERKSVTNQLMIVCEDPSCSPLGYPLFEVAGFGRAEIAGEWNGPFVKIYRLVHYQGK